MAFQIYYDAEHVYLLPSSDFSWWLDQDKKYGTEGKQWYIPADAKMKEMK